MKPPRALADHVRPVEPSHDEQSIASDLQGLTSVRSKTLFLSEAVVANVEAASMKQYDASLPFMDVHALQRSRQPRNGGVHLGHNLKRIDTSRIIQAEGIPVLTRPS